MKCIDCHLVDVRAAYHASGTVRTLLGVFNRPVLLVVRPSLNSFALFFVKSDIKIQKVLINLLMSLGVQLHF